MSKKLCYIGLLLLLVTASFSAVADPDLFWHIAIGRFILDTWEVPVRDHWNLYSDPDQIFRAYSWPFEVLVAWVEPFGYTTLTFLKFLIAVSVILIFAAVFRKVSDSDVLGFLVAALTFLEITGHFGLRPPVISWILYLLFIFALHRLQQHSSKSCYLYLGLLSMLYANIHISFVYLFPLIPAFFFSQPRRAAKLLLVTFLGTLLTPYYGGQWFTLFGKFDHAFYREIVEFSVADFSFIGFKLLFIKIFFLSLLLRRCFKITDLPLYALLILYTYLGLETVKLFPYAAILFNFVLLRCYAQLPPTDEIRRAVQRLLLLYRKVHLFLLPLVVVGLFFSSRPLLTTSIDQHYPVKAVEFIKTQGFGAPVLNIFHHGGYLMYALNQKVVIDGRTNVNSPKIWKLFRDAQLGRSNWEEYINYVQPEVILWDSETVLVNLLEAQGKWCRVYDDGRYTVLRRKSDLGTLECLG